MTRDTRRLARGWVSGMASTVEYEVLVHDEDGSLWAEIPDLPGLFVSGDSDAELAEALAEAIPMYLGSVGSR